MSHKPKRYYLSYFQLHSHVYINNFTDDSWGGRFDMPKEMAHSHLGMATDGRYIYVVTNSMAHSVEGLQLVHLCLTLKAMAGST